jgi:hypothetical protein
MLAEKRTAPKTGLTVFNLKLGDVFPDMFGKTPRSITEHILTHPNKPFDVTPFVGRCCKHPIEEIRSILPKQAIKLKEMLHHIGEFNHPALKCRD